MLHGKRIKPRGEINIECCGWKGIKHRFENAGNILLYVGVGIVAAVVRMSDKMERVKTLSKGEKAEVTDEKIRDTLVDLANYAIMTVMEL